MFAIAPLSSVAQSNFYALDHIPEIRLYFSQSNWDHVLDSLYILGSEFRLGADATIDGIAYDKVGVRYKGFSSYSSARDKNPLNIDLDYAINSQNHQGYSKVKLSNVIQDPSFIREVLSYDIARKYMPASLANFANVYINDAFVGVYTNVETITEDFLVEKFGDGDGTFVKCNPETVDLNGENSNLGDSPGTDLINYSSLYSMRSSRSNDWANLYELITVLNNDPANIESVLNVDRTLWMHAFNYAVVNFDSYIGYAQNYYLYQDHNNQFHPILWDMNMSFGSYRLSDASDNWDGFSIQEAKTIDPLQHLNSFSVQPRPLLRNLLENETYQRMYLAHLWTIVEENFQNNDYYARAQYLQSIVDSSVQADTNKFYSYQDFQDNLDGTVSDLVDYPGIKDLMEGRTNYLMNYPGVQARPEISNVLVSPTETTVGDTVWISADVTGQVISAKLAYRFADTELFQWIEMFDDGSHADGSSGDGQFGVYIENVSNLLEYYVYVENDSAGRFSPDRAAFEFYQHASKIRSGDLVINEVMPQNALEMDEFGEYDGWLELYNTTPYSISLEHLYLSNDASNLTQWTLPNTTIAANAYLKIWLDETPIQGSNHTNFSLTGDSNSLFLSNQDGTILESVPIDAVTDITSFGRFPNGTGSFSELKPTPGLENLEVTEKLLTDAVFIYPNPAKNAFYVRWNSDEVAKLYFCTFDGRRLETEQTLNGSSVLYFDASQFAAGIYLIHVVSESGESTHKIVITHE